MKCIRRLRHWNMSVTDNVLPKGNGGTKKSPESVSTLAQGCAFRVAPQDSGMEVGTCRKVCEDGDVTEAVDALHLLVHRGCHVPSNLIYCVLRRCIKKKDLVLGRRVHDLTVQSGYESNSFLANHLICMYASHGSLVEATKVFSKVSAPSIYMWASIILAYARHGEPSQAIGLYQLMSESDVKPDNHIFVAVLKACTFAGDLAAGKDVHSHILVRSGMPDMYVQNCLVDMYAKCGSLEDARQVFDRLPHKDIVTWNTMIAGYSQNGMGERAFNLFNIMQQSGVAQPNSVTFVCLMQACAREGVPALYLGRKIHAQIEERGLQTDVVVSNCIVTMYARCGRVETARQLFDKLSHKDVVTWNAMISGYAQMGLCQEAICLYGSMQQWGVIQPNSVTFTCLLQACASAADLPLGKKLHAQIQEQGLHTDVLVGSSLVNMYAKCGSIDESQQVFDSLPEREIVAWGALIAGYARQGNGEIVMDLFDKMRLEAIWPDGVTFLSVLTVCTHAGLVEKGRMYFEAMSRDYGITPSIQHYTCMMYLLGCEGHLEEALEMVKTMPYQADYAVWLTLLDACWKWSNVELGRQAFESAATIDERDAAAYVLMSSIYVGSQMWKEANEIQARRVKCGAWKKPGQSWCTDIDGVVHEFVVGDRKHLG